MPDIGVESIEAPSTNGGGDALLVEPKWTVLAREDALSGKLVRGRFKVSSANSRMNSKPKVLLLKIGIPPQSARGQALK